MKTAFRGQQRWVVTVRAWESDFLSRVMTESRSVFTPFSPKGDDYCTYQGAAGALGRKCLALGLAPFTHRKCPSRSQACFPAWKGGISGSWPPSSVPPKVPCDWAVFENGMIVPFLSPSRHSLKGTMKSRRRKCSAVAAMCR